MTPYRRGATLEREAAELLRQEGYGLVVRVAGSRGVADVIASRVGIPAERGDPLGQMKISSKAKALGVTRDATALLLACGLALRSFDEDAKY